jgi:hypothetical protein
MLRERDNGVRPGKLGRSMLRPYRVMLALVCMNKSARLPDPVGANSRRPLQKHKSDTF